MPTSRHDVLEQGMALQKAKKYPPEIQTEQLLQALGMVTGLGTAQVSMMLIERTRDNPGAPFAALVDFLDDCFPKNRERRHK